MVEQVLFKERMLVYKQMELASLSIAGNLFKEGREILSSIFDLCFPWASREIENEEQKKKKEFIDMAKNFGKDN